MANSKFYEDKRKEELFGKWLDNHFYVKIRDKYKSIIRNTDVNLQKQGVDVIIETNEGEKIYIDEKATLQYINKNIPTFAFEIKNVASGAQGWLYNPDYITDYYLLAWPNASDENIPDWKSFTRAEVMIIKRDSIIQMLAGKGLTKTKILELIEEYKKQADKDNNKFTIANGITLNFNFFLKEQPINIVIKKEILKEYAIHYTTVS